MNALPDPVAIAESTRAMAEVNRWLAGRTAAQRVAWALETLAGEHALSSSFGAQAAVSLHLATRQAPRMPVILIDTGHLFPETYRFVDEMRDRLDLNLQVYRPLTASAWPSAHLDRLRERGAEGIARYNRAHKVEPMQRALAELGVSTWIAGLRRGQSSTRSGIDFLELRDGRWKLHPLADWSDRDVFVYLTQHGLPYHPLWHQGYVSIGDVHTTRRWEPGMREEDVRYFGIRRECGLHFDEEAERAA
jgi:phosphoadenosine phosphosulfate reductase